MVPCTRSPEHNRNKRHSSFTEYRLQTTVSDKLHYVNWTKSSPLPRLFHAIRNTFSMGRYSFTV